VTAGAGQSSLAIATLALAGLALVVIAGALSLEDMLLASLGAGAGALLVRRRSVQRCGDPMAAARTELARARRQDEAADVLVVRVDRRGHPSDVAAALRVTDGVSVSRRPRGWEICAVVPADDREAARGAVERRLVRIAGEAVAPGWASFPADGFTLDSLCEHARTEAGAASSQRLVWGPATLPEQASGSVAIEERGAAGPAR
jgi:hypothetical protein